jgi:hypothetical protein
MSCVTGARAACGVGIGGGCACPHRRPRVLGELNGSHPHAARSGMDEDRLALRQMAGGEQTLVGYSEATGTQAARGASSPSGIGHVMIAGTARLAA